METATAVEIDKGRLRQLLLNDFHKRFGKAFAKTAPAFPPLPQRRRRPSSLEKAITNKPPNTKFRLLPRIGGETVPDAKTMVRWGTALGSAVIRQIHETVVEVSRETRVVSGRKLRVDTTVVETNIHYPTDSRLLGDGLRVLTRTMKYIQREVGQAGTRLRDRLRSVKHRLIEISRAAKGRGQQAEEKIQRSYERLMDTTRQVLSQAKTFVEEVVSGIKPATTPLGEMRLKAWVEQLKHFRQLTERVLEQTKARVMEGNTHFQDKLLSLFEEHTEAIRKGKGGKVTLFVDGKPAGDGPIPMTQAMIFSADDGFDVGEDSGAPVSPDYGPVGNGFNGEVKGVLLSIADDPKNSGQVIAAEDAIKMLMGRQ